jgi:hypothetical protein
MLCQYQAYGTENGLFGTLDASIKDMLEHYPPVMTQTSI